MLMLRGLDCCMVKGGASVRLLALETSPWSLCMACAGQVAHALPGSCCAKRKGSWLARNLGHQTILVCGDQCCRLAGNDPRPGARISAFCRPQALCISISLRLSPDTWFAA